MNQLQDEELKKRIGHEKTRNQQLMSLITLQQQKISHLEDKLISTDSVSVQKHSVLKEITLDENVIIEEKDEADCESEKKYKTLYASMKENNGKLMNGNDKNAMVETEANEDISKKENINKMTSNGFKKIGTLIAQNKKYSARMKTQRSIPSVITNRKEYETVSKRNKIGNKLIEAIMRTKIQSIPNSTCNATLNAGEISSKGSIAISFNEKPLLTNRSPTKNKGMAGYIVPVKYKTNVKLSQVKGNSSFDYNKPKGLKNNTKSFENILKQKGEKLPTKKVSGIFNKTQQLKSNANIKIPLK